ncbi:hypothetical protein [Streptomyces sp. NPDC127040]|uniref:hypothetical protein n=1 Tax=Streptomyces sp. NPDC127040 TaxID=3347116 RepID=UPI00366190F0
MTTQPGPLARDEGAGTAEYPNHQELTAMRSTRPTTTQTTCDCEDCPSYAITGHMRRTTPTNQAAHHHHQAAAADGWSDVEGRDYCPGCPAAVPAEDHDHAGQ